MNRLVDYLRVFAMLRKKKKEKERERYGVFILNQKDARQVMNHSMPEIKPITVH